MRAPLTNLLLAVMPALWPAAAQSEAYRPLDFALVISENKTRLNHGSTDVNTKIQRIGVAWQELYGERLRLGLLGGYSFVTQTGNPASAGLELDGYHAGIAFNADLIQRQRFTIFFAGAYVYERTKDERSAQSVDLSWSVPSARLGALVRLNEWVQLTGGMQYSYLEGRERVRGATNQTLDIDRRHETGWFVGLTLTVDANGGYVGISGQSGVERGGAIYFGRRF